MKKYVLGFMFNSDLTQVVLIKKNRPTWQRDFLNGVGGKVEYLEKKIDSMVREFREETGYETLPDEWRIISDLNSPEFEVRVYCAVSQHDLYSLVSSNTDEEVGIYNVSEIDSLKVISNLKWLIKMCLDPNCGRGIIHYS